MAAPAPAANPDPGVLRHPAALVPLAIGDLAAFPYRQRVDVVRLAPDAIGAAVAQSLSAAGFEITVAGPAIGGGAPEVTRTGYVAERNVRRARLRADQVATIVGLVVAGLVLGVTDALVVGDLAIALPWFAGFVGVAALFRLRMGGAYVSEAIVVVVARAPGAPGAWTTDWAAGLVRSAGEVGPTPQRATLGVEPSIPVAGALGTSVAEFRRRAA